MNEYSAQFGWPTAPNRDQALDLVYDFIRQIAARDLDKAADLILVKDMPFFIAKLHDSFLKYLEMVIEDDEWEKYADKNLAFEVDNPEELDENLTMPEFSGNQLLLSVGEDVSVQLGLRGTVTPIRVHFQLVEADAVYFLKLQRITAK